MYTIRKRGDKTFRNKLPRGTIARVAKENDLSWTAVKDVADGVNRNRPEIMTQLINAFFEEVKSQEALDKIRRKNERLMEKIKS